MDIWKRISILAAVIFLVAGCSSPVVRYDAQDSKTADQYTRIKRVAVFPFENVSDGKDADKVVEVLLPTALRQEKIFDEVEDTRFVRDTMKKLKITSSDILEKEVVKKLGDEMNVQGVIYGKIVQYGPGKEKESGNRTTMDMSLVEPSTGRVLWLGNTTFYGGMTFGKVFGVTEGYTDMETARAAIRALASSLGDSVEEAREKEKKGIVAVLKKEQDIERAKLEKLKGETGAIQSNIDKSNAEAKAIRDAAVKDAESMKKDLELQKASVEAEKAKTQALQQEIDQEKLKVEVERKKAAEDLQKIEDEKRALEEARKKAAGAPPAPEAPKP